MKASGRSIDQVARVLEMLRAYFVEVATKKRVDASPEIRIAGPKNLRLLSHQDDAPDDRVEEADDRMVASRNLAYGTSSKNEGPDFKVEGTDPDVDGTELGLGASVKNVDATRFEGE